MSLLYLLLEEGKAILLHQFVSFSFLHYYFHSLVFSVRPPSLADPDLSPAEEEIPAPAADRKSEDESSDDAPSV